MKPGLKVTLGVIGGAVLCLGIGGTVWWRHAEAGLKQELLSGRAMGVHLSDRECEDSALARLVPRDRSFARALNERLVFAGCLSTSRVTDILCANVPPDDMTHAAMWAVQQCRQRDEIGDAACVGVFEQLVEQCGRRRRGA